MSLACTGRDVTIQQGNPLRLYDLIKQIDGTDIQQANLSAITYSVYLWDSTTQDTAVAGPTTISIATSIFDTVQTATEDPNWPGSGVTGYTGFNFRADIAAAAFNEGPRTYMVVVTFETTSGDDFTVAWKVRTTEVLG